MSDDMWHCVHHRDADELRAENARLRDEVAKLNETLDNEPEQVNWDHLTAERDEARAQLARAVELLCASQEFVEVPWGGSAQDKHKIAVIQFLRTTEGGTK